MFRNIDDAVHYNSNLTLSIQNNIANGFFETESETKGCMFLNFIEPGVINAKIEYTDGFSGHSQYLLDGYFNFIPLNIADIDGFVEINELSFSAHLDIWGEVYFRVGYYEPRRVMHLPAIFLTDSKGNILYYFSAPYPVGAIPYKILLNDLNNDGLLDVMIIADDSIYDGDYSYKFTYYFYQLSNGWFRLEVGEMP